MPALVTAAVFTFIYTYNDFFSGCGEDVLKLLGQRLPVPHPFDFLAEPQVVAEVPPVEELHEPQPKPVIDGADHETPNGGAERLLGRAHPVRRAERRRDLARRPELRRLPDLQRKRRVSARGTSGRSASDVAGDCGVLLEDRP